MIALGSCVNQRRNETHTSSTEILYLTANIVFLIAYGICSFVNSNAIWVNTVPAAHLFAQINFLLISKTTRVHTAYNLTGGKGVKFGSAPQLHSLQASCFFVPYTTVCYCRQRLLDNNDNQYDWCQR